MFNHLLRDLWLQHTDQRIKSYWLASNGLLNSFYLISTYLILVKIILPRWMKNRPPYSLKWPMIIYNITMAGANLFFFAWYFKLSRGGRELFNCVAPSQYDTSERQLDTIQFMHLYIWSKFVDLLETVCFVLRKKNSQLTFLHLYHHSMVPAIATISFILYPSSTPAGLFAFFNSLTHAVMYSYYGLSAFGPSMRPYLWWKAVVTQLQIVQFLIFFIFSLAYIFNAQGYSKGYIYIGLSQSPFFAFLFLRFYFRTYLTKSDDVKANTLIKTD